VCRGASIGSGAVIMCGVRIGAEALVGAAALVTHDVPPFAIVAGVPAKVVGDVRERMTNPNEPNEESRAKAQRRKGSS
jgi:acetyltransferase-like isoleucine patch superfamily enzyme